MENRSRNNQTLIGILCAIGAAAGFGIGSSYLKVLYRSFGTIAFQDLLFMRSFVALVFFLVLAFKKGISCLRVRARELFLYLFAGAAGFFAVAYFLLLSLSRIPAGMTAFTQSSATILVCIFSYLIFREKITRTKIIGIAVGLAGLALIVLQAGELGGSALFVSGILAAFGSAAGKTVYILSGRSAGRRKQKIPLMVYGMTVCTLMSLPLISPPATYVRLFSDWRAAVAILAYCLFFSAMPYLLAFRAAEILPASTSGSLNVVEPMVTAFSAFFLLGEMLRVQQLFGAVLIVISVILNSRPSSVGTGGGEERTNPDCGESEEITE